MRFARSHPQGPASGGLVPLSGIDAGFHRVGGKTVITDRKLCYMGGLGEGLGHHLFVAFVKAEVDIAGIIRPQQRRVWHGGGIRLGDAR